VNPINLDRIPNVARPPEIERAISEARELRRRHRLAQEELARTQQALEQAQEADVAAQAERVRQGAEPGAVPAAIRKAKEAVEVAQRNANAIGRAHAQAGQDVAGAIAERSDAWNVALAAELEQAREQAQAALAAFKAATVRINAADGTSWWLSGALADGRFDRLAKVGVSHAPSSRRVTMNGEPLSSQEIVAFAREMVAPPAPEPEPAVEPRQLARRP
jgi:hypothetical protein